MQTLQLHLPDTFEVDPLELKMAMASKLYELGKLSLGQAAQFVGISKRTFIELLGQYQVSLFNYDASEVEEDFKNA